MELRVGCQEMIFCEEASAHSEDMTLAQQLHGALSVVPEEQPLVRGFNCHQETTVNFA